MSPKKKRQLFRSLKKITTPGIRTLTKIIMALLFLLLLSLPFWVGSIVR